VAWLPWTAPLYVQQVQAGTVEQWGRRGGPFQPMAVWPRSRGVSFRGTMCAQGILPRQSVIGICLVHT